MENPLVKLENARRQIAECRDLNEAKGMADQAAAAAIYCRKAKLGLEAQNDCAEIKIRAERQAGVLLKGLEKSPGGRPGKNSSIDGHVFAGTRPAPPEPAVFGPFGPDADNLRCLDGDSSHPDNGLGSICDDGEAEAGAPGLRDLTDKQPPPPPRRAPGSEYKQALAGAGATRQDAHRWQAAAAMPAKQFEAHISQVRGAGRELTSAGVLREIRKTEATKKKPKLPDGKYRVIYADPPWSYGNSGVINETDGYGRAARHYPSMSIAELCELKIKDLAAADSVLFMWVTSPLLAECWPVIKAWGFKYKTSFVWDKIGHNFGHYNSVRHELLLVCTRGSCTPDSSKLIDSVQSIAKTRKHSEKPPEFRAIIDEMYTHGRRIELFARLEVEGWDAWGSES